MRMIGVASGQITRLVLGPRVQTVRSLLVNWLPIQPPITRMLLQYAEYQVPLRLPQLSHYSPKINFLLLFCVFEVDSHTHDEFVYNYVLCHTHFLEHSSKVQREIVGS